MTEEKETPQLLPTEQLNSLVAGLRTSFPNLDELAKALYTNRRTLGRAQKGKGGARFVLELVNRAQKLLETRTDEQPREQPRPPPREESQPEPTAPEQKAKDLLERFGGETSPLGVRFVLDPSSFKEIGGDPGAEGVAYAKRVLQLARAVLNLFCQLKDPLIRTRVRETLGREVEELELAIRLFSVEHPNRLTSLNQAQRRMWARESGKKKG